MNNQRCGAIINDVSIDHHLFDITRRWNIKHWLHQDIFHDRPKPTRACFPLNRLFGNGFQRVITEFKIDVIHFKQLLILLQKRIFRLGQNLNQGVFIKVFKRRHNWQTANKFRDQTKFDQVFGLKFGKKFTNFAVIWIADISTKTNTSTRMATGDQLVETGKGSATNEQNIGGINLQKFLLGVLAPPCGGTDATVPSIIFSKAC